MFSAFGNRLRGSSKRQRSTVRRFIARIRCEIGQHHLEFPFVGHQRRQVLPCFDDNKKRSGKGVRKGLFELLKKSDRVNTLDAKFTMSGEGEKEACDGGASIGNAIHDLQDVASGGGVALHVCDSHPHTAPHRLKNIGKILRDTARELPKHLQPPSVFFPDLGCLVGGGLLPNLTLHIQGQPP